MADAIAIYYWQMSLPIYVKPHAFNFATSVMAGVIAWWQMEWPLQGDLWQMLFAMGQDVILVLVLRC